MMENIAKAFVKAQKEFGTAHKTSNNPFFKSKYADLSVVIAAVLDSLNNNGIALIQNCHESDTGVIVETIFLHESGECISCGRLSVPAAKNDPQGYGSALTYGRRYSLMAACGIAPEDDDGNAATKAVHSAPVKKSPAPNLIPPPLSQNEVDDCILAMNGCTDMEALKGIFGGAYKRGDELQKTILADIYNAKKILLETK
jgi:hypothetical protein